MRTKKIRLSMALFLISLLFSLNTFSQETLDKPMKATALASMIEELKGVVSRSARDKSHPDRIFEKWNGRSDLAGKSQKAVVDFLYSDVESVIQDSEVRYQIFSLFSFYKRVPFGVKPKPSYQLVDEFQRSNCEDLQARLDSFALMLQDTPGSNGYIVTYGTAQQSRAVKREARYAFDLKGIEAGRIIYGGRTGNTKDARVVLWLVPEGANRPQPSQISGDGLKVSSRKPFIFGQKSAGDMEACSDYDPEFFADTLNANPESRGNIVIYETSRSAFEAEEKKLVSILENRGVESTRLKTFYVPVKRGSLRQGIRLWLLP